MSYWKAWFYAGPYVPSGVLYGRGPSACHWLIPGYDIDSYKINMYEKSIGVWK